MNNSPAACSECNKTSTSGNNKKPNSLHKTKRQIHPNLQQVNGELLCTRCIKTKFKPLK